LVLKEILLQLKQVQTVLTMPIISPLADTVGIGREVIVNAYQYGMGLLPSSIQPDLS